MKKLAKATGAKIVSNIQEISKDDLGYAGLVEERTIGDDEMTFVERCKNPKAVSIMLRGGTEHVVDELERAMHDALCVVGVAVEDGTFVVGGGAAEMEVASKLRKYAPTVGGRGQLAVEAFADALEVVPRTLAESAGLDQIDTLVELRAEHEKGNKYAGLDVHTGKVSDMQKIGIIEPARIKMQAIGSAAEAAMMILRIDDVIAAGKLKEEGAGGSPKGMPEGMEY